MIRAVRQSPRTATRKGNDGPKASTDDSPVAFEYIKSQLFRVIHADGVIGSVTPSGNVHVAFFSERPAIPRMMVHARNPNGTLGDPIPEQTLVRPGVIREMDVDVVLSPAALDLMLTWLTDRKRELIDRNELVKKIESSKK
jgi:hypothetical protein